MTPNSRNQKGSKLKELAFGRSTPSSIARGASLLLGAVAIFTFLYTRERNALVPSMRSRQGRQLMALSQFRDPVSTVMKSNAVHDQPCVTLECIKSSDPSQIDWDNIFKGQPTRDLPVPRILHHVILGENAPPSMFRLVKWNFHHIRSNGYETKLWRDADVEELIDTYGPRVREMWEYAKADKSNSRAARLKDIVCILILFAEGGVHVDADTILCGKQADNMVDKPGVVSFPFQQDISDQVTPAIVSAPPGHKLMGSAMEFFISQGPEIATAPILEATGPHAFAKVVDEYIKESGIDRPSIYSGNIGYPQGGGPVPGGEFWALQIADLRFGMNFMNMNMWHIGFGTWIKNRAVPLVRPCDENVDLVYPWIDDFCTHPSQRDTFSTGCFFPVAQK